MKPTSQRWAHFRFSVIGTLLASPPEAHGDLAQAVQRLAEKTWVHPTSGKSVQYQASTIERWYYLVAHQVAGGDTIASLARKRRSDAGRTIITPELAAALLAQYQKHRSWSAKLHFDNIVELINANSALGVAPSYQTVRRFYRNKGLMRLPRRRGDERFELPGQLRHLLTLTVRYARWDLTHVHVICDQTGLVLAPLYPLDKTKNADGRRRALPTAPVVLPRQESSDDQMAPLLKRLMADFAATGRPPAYLPQTYEP